MSSLQPITLANVAQIAQITTLNPGTNDIISSLAFSPDGTTMAVAVGKVINLLDVATGKVLTTFDGTKDVILSVVFSPDGKTLASGSQDQTVGLWDIEKSVVPPRLFYNHIVIAMI